LKESRDEVETFRWSPLFLMDCHRIRQQYTFIGVSNLLLTCMLFSLLLV